ncbi:MAG: hypothetical protein AAF413_01355 [Patescibacteria group bacterium]
MKKVIFVGLSTLVIMLAFILISNSRQDEQQFNTNSAVSGFVDGGELIKNGSDRTQGPYTELVINVYECVEGRDSSYFGFGHTEFLSYGLDNGSCKFDYGTEIENPNWDGELTVACTVPQNTIVRLSKTDNGIDFSPISMYCSSI